MEKEMRVRDLGEGKGYGVVTFPKSRLATLDLGRLYRGKHYMFGLLEVDVTNSRMAARELRSKGQPVSFTAWMIKAIGNAIAGAIGGGIMGQLIGNMAGQMIEGWVGDIAGGGVGGIILTLIAGAIRNMTAK